MDVVGNLGLSLIGYNEFNKCGLGWEGASYGYPELLGFHHLASLDGTFCKLRSCDYLACCVLGEMGLENRVSALPLCPSEECGVRFAFRGVDQTNHSGRKPGGGCSICGIDRRVLEYEISNERGFHPNTKKLEV